MDFSDPRLAGVTSKQERIRIIEEDRKKKQHDQNLSAQQSAPIRPAISTSGSQSSPASMTLEQLQQELFNRKKELKEKADKVVLDADSYRVNIPAIKLLTEDKNLEERLSYSGNVAVATGVPIIIVLCYLGEIYGFSEKLEEKIKNLMTFYTVSEILNIKK